eukprot:Skav219422  [mRNA]  locus=scaffold571:219333:222977:- [translate_table: standard]
MEKGRLPPIYTQYVRANLAAVMTPAKVQEALTLAHAIDGLLQGKVAASCDVLSQRLKSLESTARGTHWSVGRQMELVRSDPTSMSDETETLEALRRAKEEDKLRSLSSKEFAVQDPLLEAQTKRKERGEERPPKTRKEKESKRRLDFKEADRDGFGRNADYEAKGVAAPILPEDVEELIERAQRASEEATTGAIQSSQSSFHRTVASFLRKAQEQADGRVNLLQLGGAVHDILMLCETSSACRSTPMTGKLDIFPLPVPRCQDGTSHLSEFLQALIASLNSLNGIGMRGSSTTASLRVVKRLNDLVVRAEWLREPIPQLDFQEFFRTRGVDYAGEEVKLARSISWEEIRHSLPDQVGTLDIRDFAEGGVLDYIINFEEYLIPEDDRFVGKTPDVRIKDGDWLQVAKGLVSAGVCTILPKSKVFHVGDRPLLSGLFSVSKQEFVGETEVCRLIMNLKPLNLVCRALVGDTGTLPSIHTMGALYLEDNELLCVSSEDIRCFFYLFQVPSQWWGYMAFGREVPLELVKDPLEPGPYYLASRVLPMGFANSVAIAQHIHRLVVRRSMGSYPHGLGAESGLRRDKVFPQHSSLFRIYLDNFDQLERVDTQLADLIKGTPSEVVQSLRKSYTAAGLPRHPKKAVERSLQAEVQGAWIDGVAGTCSAKPSKILKYVALTLQLVAAGKASQRELQVVSGGLVYIAMFRRPLLAGLNAVWRAIVGMDRLPARARSVLPPPVIKELVRFLGLLPLAFTDFRATFDSTVTASDASTTGGGLCASRGLTPYGQAASLSVVRGDVPEEHDFCQVLSIGLFDGIGGLRTALDVLGLPMAGHVSVEKSQEANRVVEAAFPDTITVGDINDIDEEMVKSWATRFSSVGIIVVGAGPPCQGVSGLNYDKKGALKDARSVLFKQVPRVVALVKRCFPWAQVHELFESVASMSYEDCDLMSTEFENLPWYIDADGVSLCHRPRLYWVSWELLLNSGVEIWEGSDGRLPIKGEVKLCAELVAKRYLEAGWQLQEGQVLPTFTTSRPSPTPLRRPAGLASCKTHELARWKSDLHRFPPYQYKDENCLHHKSLEPRIPGIREREVVMGFPAGFTKQCMKKALHDTPDHRDCRRW